MDTRTRQLMEKIVSVPDERLAEIEDFVEFIRQQEPIAIEGRYSMLLFEGLNTCATMPPATDHVEGDLTRAVKVLKGHATRTAGG